MLIKKLIIGLLSFYAFEIKQSSKRFEGNPFNEITIERELETRKKKEAEKKKTRLYDKRKWKKKKSYHERTYKLKGIRPKDARFSDQQKLRRMYRSG